jgi:hypothetical protein
MRKLYSPLQPFMVEQMKFILESHHIACVMRNAYLGGAAGELPPIECLPELWVLDDGQFARARELLDAFRQGAEQPAEDWTCGHCGEPLDGHFGSCWRCGADRPSWRFS